MMAGTVYCIWFCVQVQAVVGVMKDNLEKVLERDSKLSDLDTRYCVHCTVYTKVSTDDKVSNLNVHTIESKYTKILRHCYFRSFFDIF